MTADTAKPAIVADHLTKVYRLYERPQQRILDVLGFGRRGNYTEHFALDDVSITVSRGERLGLIGRNGAGKSTFLKLVSGVTPPTSGSIKVNGNARALLEIGTGFHPEFTGRENAKAYFAQLGISGRQASKLVDEVIDFAELEEYIDQPIKIYSTGMKLRLMFATSTVTAPDILVLDEVLGVGDAYFTRKSFERINELSSREGATLLLVSHDIYTSARICDRMVWLEKGRVVFDGEPKDAVKAYEDSIRQQEEARLRAKSLLALKRDQAAPPKFKRRTAQTETVQVEVTSPDGGPLAAPVWFRSVRLLRGELELAALPLFAHAVDGGALDAEGTCWGEVAAWQGEQARPMRDFGSPFHRVSGSFSPVPVATAEPEEMTLLVDWGADVAVHVLVSCRMGTRLVARRNLKVGGLGWERTELAWGTAEAESSPIEEAPERAAVFGTGRIRIGDVHLYDTSGQETHTFWHGDPFHLSFDYEIRDPDLEENCDIVVAILRGGVDTACRVLTRSLLLSYTQARTGTIELALDRLMLGTGLYTASVLIGRNGYYERESHMFYSVNPEVHACLRDLVEFSVRARGILADGTPWVAEGAWRLLPSRPTDFSCMTPPPPKARDENSYSCGQPINTQRLG
jgi:ABC-type polysaccharide/polyol phosphate transport system ATPase subunit